jgi:hypothetical protein
LSSRFLSKNVKIKIHKIIILPLVWYGRERKDIDCVFEQSAEENIWKKETGSNEWKRLEIHTKYRTEYPNERDYLGDQDID